MMNQQKKRRRIRGFVNRLKFRIANWLLKPFNLMIVSATSFNSIRYVQNQMAMYVERSGALPQRLKARSKLRQYLAAQKFAINDATDMPLDPIELDKMPPALEALASVLQEAERHREVKGSSNTNLAETRPPYVTGIEMRRD